MPRRQLETDIEQKCIAYAVAQDCDYVKLDKAKKDYPDQLFFLPCSGTLLVEFKRPGEEPRKRQTVIHQRLAALGHPVSVVDSEDQFRRLLLATLELRTIPRVPPE